MLQACSGLTDACACVPPGGAWAAVAAFWLLVVRAEVLAVATLRRANPLLFLAVLHARGGDVLFTRVTIPLLVGAPDEGECIAAADRYAAAIEAAISRRVSHTCAQS